MIFSSVQVALPYRHSDNTVPQQDQKFETLLNLPKEIKDEIFMKLPDRMTRVNFSMVSRYCHFLASEHIAKLLPLVQRESEILEESYLLSEALVHVNSRFRSKYSKLNLEKFEYFLCCFLNKSKYVSDDEDRLAYDGYMDATKVTFLAKNLHLLSDICKSHAKKYAIKAPNHRKGGHINFAEVIEKIAIRSAEEVAENLYNKNLQICENMMQISFWISKENADFPLSFGSVNSALFSGLNGIVIDRYVQNLNKETLNVVAENILHECKHRRINAYSNMPFIFRNMKSFCWDPASTTRNRINIQQNFIARVRDDYPGGNTKESVLHAISEGLFNRLQEFIEGISSEKEKNAWKAMMG